MNRVLAVMACAGSLAFALPLLMAASPAAAQSGSAEWFPAFETDTMFGALDRSSVRRQESHAFPTGADVRGIHVLFVPKAGAAYAGTQYGYVVAHAAVACDRNEITWTREEYFHFAQTGVQAVLSPPAAERKTITPDTIDYQVGYGACTDNAMTGTPITSSDRLAILAKANLMASSSPPSRTGWMVVQAGMQQTMALDMGSIKPATGQYAGSDLLQATTVTLSRGGTMFDGTRYDYVVHTHLIRCQAGATAVASTDFYNFDSTGLGSDNSRRTIGPRLAPVEPGSAGAEALIIACNLAPATAETLEFGALLGALRGMAGL